MVALSEILILRPVEQLLVSGASGSSRILVGVSIDSLKTYIDVARTVIITDNAVVQNHRSVLPDCPIITIGQGEPIKTLETVSVPRLGKQWKQLTASL